MSPRLHSSEWGDVAAAGSDATRAHVGGRLESSLEQACCSVEGRPETGAAIAQWGTSRPRRCRVDSTSSISHGGSGSRPSTSAPKTPHPKEREAGRRAREPFDREVVIEILTRDISGSAVHGCLPQLFIGRPVDRRELAGRADLNLMVGETGLEPATPSPPDWCANHLRYSPRPVVEHIRQ